MTPKLKELLSNTRKMPLRVGIFFLFYFIDFAFLDASIDNK
jgi:hypothetical protein